MSKIKVSVVNVVVTCDLKTRIDLRKTVRIPGFKYDPRIYQGKVAYFKNHETKGKVSVFNSGKLISIGTKSEKEAVHDLKYVTKLLIKANLIKSTFTSYKVRNVVALADLGRRVDLEHLVGRLKGVIYEPEQFPGVIIKLSNFERMTVLLFASGKIVIAGLKTTEGLHEKVDKIIKLLQLTEKT